MEAVSNFNYTDFKRYVDLSFHLLENEKIVKVLAPVECPINISDVRPDKAAAHLCPEESDILLGKIPGKKRELAVKIKVCDIKENDYCEKNFKKINLYMKKIFF